jgi:hypothetical protein
MMVSFDHRKIKIIGGPRDRWRQIRKYIQNRVEKKRKKNCLWKDREKQGTSYRKTLAETQRMI